VRVIDAGGNPAVRSVHVTVAGRPDHR